jgi:hypothetical protein
MPIAQYNFDDFLQSIYKGYNSDIIGNLPKSKDFPLSLFVGEKINIDKLVQFVDNQDKGAQNTIIPVAKRILAILMIQDARENNKNLNIGFIWKLVSESILSLPKNFTISSIGSQGFLSIPLYKCDFDKENFEFIRLHIWDKSLDDKIDVEICKKFSIHTHSFYAKSWIVTGRVINNTYLVTDDGNESAKHSLFTVAYNNSLNNVNQHTSKAINTGKNVIVRATSEEVHVKGSSYEIMAGSYHQSGHQNDTGVSATIFSFTAKDGLVNNSYVAGPSEISDSEINRKMYVDPTDLFHKIEQQLLVEL